MKTMKTVRTFALLLVLAALLSACSAGAMELKFENGALRDEKNDVTFLSAPFNYKAVAIEPDRQVAIIKTSKGADVPLYAVEGMDRAKWIAREDYTLYYRSDVSLPTLREMQVTYVTVSRVSGTALEAGRLESRAEIDDLVETYEQGTTIPRDKVTVTPAARFELLFFSDTYAGISYSLEYWKFDSEVIVYAALTESGEIPSLYPGISASIEEVSGERVAVFRLGKGLIYDRVQNCVYAVGSVVEDYFNAA